MEYRQMKQYIKKHNGYKVKFTKFDKDSHTYKEQGYRYLIQWYDNKNLNANSLVAYSYHANLYKMIKYYNQHKKVMQYANEC